VNKQVVRTERTASGNIDDICTAKYASGGGLIGADYDYFVATKSCTIHNGLTVTGNCKLILCDGVTVTIDPHNSGGGIEVAKGNSLKIYAQSQGANANAGKLIVNVKSTFSQAGIGGCFNIQTENYDAGTIEIHGGYVEAHGGHLCAGIGGGQSANGLDVTVDGGHVDAYGGTDAAGIGTGENYRTGCGTTYREGSIPTSLSGMESIS
jgi:hypothetical protein